MMDMMPSRAGACFKAEHFRDIITDAPDVGFFEVHAENYMGDGGPPHAHLTKIREDYALSIHGVGLSIGGAAPLDTQHLDRLKGLVDRYQPHLFSEHLAWSTHTTGYVNDLLALPYTAETRDVVVDHIDQLQNHIGRQMLLENPSTYVTFEDSTMDEIDFIAEVAYRSGCGLLLDVNNVYVSSVNQGWDAADYIRRYPLALVQQIHLAGHTETEDASGARLLIDTHNGPFIDPVATLYSQVLKARAALPTLIEWDNDLPTWSELFADTQRAQAMMDQHAGLNDAASDNGARHVA